jgi:uncharacterized membrane protein
MAMTTGYTGDVELFETIITGYSVNTEDKKPQLSTSRLRLGFRIHWHVILTHFPISIFAVSFGFMLLHLITGASCFELASYLTLIAGAAAMIPTTLTGWREWKTRYQGYKSRLFQNKIRISFAMIGISIALTIYRSFFLVQFDNVVQHIVYFTCILFLLVGALAEGFYGGQLSHR